jgi:GNAT superfamily N-acetyltransferase
LEIYNIKDKLEYLEEIVELTHNEWGNRILSEEDYRVWLQKKIISIKSMLDRNDYCKLILLDEDNLVGFISLFPTDGDERSDLSPWYATMFVKKEYRGRGCSKILNDALLKESKKRGFERVYLKIDLNGYYEKFRCRVHARFRKWRKTV